MKLIRITAGDVVVRGRLNDGPTAQALWEALPLQGAANCWGQEIYFSVPIEAGLEPDAREKMEVGALAFWPPSSALCIFFGRTPASRGDEPRAASPVNVVGNLIDDCAALNDVDGGQTIRIEAEAEA